MTGMTCKRWLMLICAVAVCPAARAQVGASGPTTHGFRIDGLVADSLGAPLAGAEVRVEGGRISAIAGRDGRYVLRDVEPGTRRLLARRVGYVPEVADVSGEAGGRLVVDFTLMRAPEVLPGVAVVERALVPEKYRFTTRYDAFFQHRATAAAGVFFDHEELERRGGVARALTGVAGVKANEFMGYLSIRFRRCGEATSPAVLVNGVLSSGSVLSTIPASSIELVEVYRGTADLPIEARGNSCGAIAIYTR